MSPIEIGLVASIILAVRAVSSDVINSVSIYIAALWPFVLVDF